MDGYREGIELSTDLASTSLCFLLSSSKRENGIHKRREHRPAIGTAMTITYPNRKEEGMDDV